MQTKFVICLLCILECLLLIGCREVINFIPTQSGDQIEKIEIIEIIDTNSINGEGNLLIMTIDTEQCDEFLRDLTLLPYYGIFNPPSSSLSGISIKISYMDGDYEIVSCFARYTSHNDSLDGWYYFEQEDYRKFLETYGVEYNEKH